MPVGSAYKIENNLRLPISQAIRLTIPGPYPYYGPTRVQDLINEFRVQGEYALIGEDGDHFLKFATFPQTQFATGKFNVNNHAHLVRGDLNSPEWFCCFFKHRDITAYLTRQGANRYKLNKANLECLLLSIPPLNEQKAIAEALSDVDGLIGALEALIDKKRQIKTGAMQQLLTGKTRLPGFGQGKGFKQTELGEIPEDWDITELGKCTTWLSGGTPNRSNELYWRGTIPWISASTLKQSEIFTSDQFITKEAVISGSKLCPVGATLLLVRGSALHNEIRAGLAIDTVAFNQDVKALLPNIEISPKYLTYYILGNSEDLLKLVTSAGNTAGVLDTKIVQNFPFVKPKKEEQEAIVKAIDFFDGEIVSLEKRLAKTKALKQGMMQELLTGRKRLI